MGPESKTLGSQPQQTLWSGFRCQLQGVEARPVKLHGTGGGTASSLHPSKRAKRSKAMCVTQRDPCSGTAWEQALRRWSGVWAAHREGQHLPFTSNTALVRDWEHWC